MPHRIRVRDRFAAQPAKRARRSVPRPHKPPERRESRALHRHHVRPGDCAPLALGLVVPTARMARALLAVRAVGDRADVDAAHQVRVGGDATGEGAGGARDRGGRRDEGQEGRDELSRSGAHARGEGHGGGRV